MLGFWPRGLRLNPVRRGIDTTKNNSREILRGMKMITLANHGIKWTQVHTSAAPAFKRPAHTKCAVLHDHDSPIK